MSLDAEKCFGLYTSCHGESKASEAAPANQDTSADEQGIHTNERSASTQDIGGLAVDARAAVDPGRKWEFTRFGALVVDPEYKPNLDNLPEDISNF